jgi:hypothetical protein
VEAADHLGDHDAAQLERDGDDVEANDHRSRSTRPRVPLAREGRP